MKLERVLMTGDTVGGVWTFTLELAASLAERGVEIVLVAFGGKASPAQVAAAKSIPGLCLLDSDYRLEWMHEPWPDIEASGRWLMEIEAEYRPDVVHLNSFGHGALHWRAPVVLTAHSCVLSWWQAVKGEKAPARWDRYRDVVAKSLAAAQLVTAPSAVMGREIEALYGLAQNTCRVVHNGRTAATFPPRPKEPFVLTAGRLWDEAKNLHAVVSAASKIPWPVYCAGDAAAGSANGCNMLGRLSESEIADWYGRASIYAMPARYEPFGFSILEAALGGCALVLGDIPSLREIWGRSAAFAPPNDPDAVATTLRTLIENPDQRRELARRARLRALGFNAHRMSRAYIAAYQEAMTAPTCLKSRSCGL